MQHWFSLYQPPADMMSAAEKGIEERVSELIAQKGRPMPGVKEIFEFFQSRSFRIGLASSSSRRLIDQVSRQLGIESYLMAVSSAESLNLGKPHPEVYLNCSALLGSRPDECLCFEDSYNGMIAVKSARMTCVVVPSKNEFHRPVWQTADLKISSLQNFKRIAPGFPLIRPHCYLILHY
ncbi:MAG: HAD-IA family hydrolase [Chitinophagaceae bacterium]|nr:HAD-IA family hydrolase [Chitinophagaceae bacterium]